MMMIEEKGTWKTRKINRYVRKMKKETTETRGEQDK